MTNSTEECRSLGAALSQISLVLKCMETHLSNICSSFIAPLHIYLVLYFLGTYSNKLGFFLTALSKIFLSNNDQEHTPVDYVRIIFNSSFKHVLGVIPGKKII